MSPGLPAHSLPGSLAETENLPACGSASEHVSVHATMHVCERATGWRFNAFGQPWVLKLATTDELFSIALGVESVYPYRDETDRPIRQSPIHPKGQE